MKRACVCVCVRVRACVCVCACVCVRVCVCVCVLPFTVSVDLSVNKEARPRSFVLMTDDSAVLPAERNNNNNNQKKKMADFLGARQLLRTQKNTRSHAFRVGVVCVTVDRAPFKNAALICEYREDVGECVRRFTVTQFVCDVCRWPRVVVSNK